MKLAAILAASLTFALGMAFRRYLERPCEPEPTPETDDWATDPWTLRPGMTIASSGTWGGSVVRCTCPPNRGDNYAGSCPIHDSYSTYTRPDALAEGGTR